jgi:hypothetical protein
MPLTRWEGLSIRAGQVGEKTRELQEWLTDEIRSRVS